MDPDLETIIQSNLELIRQSLIEVIRQDLREDTEKISKMVRRHEKQRQTPIKAIESINNRSKSKQKLSLTVSKREKSQQSMTTPTQSKIKQGIFYSAVNKKLSEQAQLPPSRFTTISKKRDWDQIISNASETPLNHTRSRRINLLMDLQ